MNEGAGSGFANTTTCDTTVLAPIWLRIALQFLMWIVSRWDEAQSAQQVERGHNGCQATNTKTASGQCGIIL